jgi:hypothetical protein
MAIKPIKSIVARQGSAKVQRREKRDAQPLLQTRTGKKPNVINPIRDYGHRTLTAKG